jgi:predicted amidohydrolase YtcJ
MVNMSVLVAFGSDVPATIVVEPRWAFIGAIARSSLGGGGHLPVPDQRISIHHALRMHTSGSAYAAFEENIKGSIEPGNLADMVVRSHDCSGAMSRQLTELHRLTTIVGGGVVYE